MEKKVSHRDFVYPQIQKMQTKQNQNKTGSQLKHHIYIQENNQ